MPTTSKGFRYPASTVAPNVPVDIQNLATDVDTYMGVTADYVPTLSWLTNTTVTSAKWRRVAGKTIVVEFLLTTTGAPTAANLTMSLPVTAGFATANRISSGTVLMRDNSVGDSSFRSGTVLLTSTTTVSFLVDSATTSGLVHGTTFPWAWAASDTIGGTFIYREA